MKAITMLLSVSLMVAADLDSTARPDRQTPSSVSQQTALLRGVLIDFISGARVPRATILFESAGLTRTVVSTEDGSYQAQLPIDVYRISVRRLGYCSSRRAAVQLQASSDTRFDFILVPCAIENVGIIESGRYKGEACREAKTFDFESFELSSSPRAKGELLLRFGTRREEQNFIEYEGAMINYLVSSQNPKEPVEKAKYLGVMVSYDSLTVYGDKVKLAKKTIELEARGNVVVEDGRKRTEASSVKIRFEAGKPILELIP